VEEGGRQVSGGRLSPKLTVLIAYG
jgi:hypothetical protein